MLSKGISIAAIVAILCVIGCAQANQKSPVFLWGASSPSKPALRTVPKAEFAAEVIQPHLKDHMIVAFLEDNLSSNDFLCANTDSAQSCYAHLQGVSHKTYYASVEQPVEALRSVAAAREYNSVGKSGKLETPLTCEPGKVIFVTFDDVSQQRGASLEAHDTAIAGITKEITCPTIYLYMSAPSTSTGAVVKSRLRRDIGDTAAPKGGILHRSGSQFLIFYTEVTLTPTGGAAEKIVIKEGGMTVTNVSETVFKVSLATADVAKSLEFNVSLTFDGYFVMSGVTYNNIMFLNNSMEAPTDFSYFCGNLTLTDASSTNTLVWNSLQVQAPFGRINDPNFVFGDAWHCVGFFSPAILSGLFIAALLLLIMFVGVCWIMDINTMDRFDDPKGKTITINAGE